MQDEKQIGRVRSILPLVIALAVTFVLLACGSAATATPVPPTATPVPDIATHTFALCYNASGSRVSFGPAGALPPPAGP